MHGYFYIFLAALLWAMMGPLVQGALDAGVAAMEIAFWRAAIAGGLFVGHALLLGRLKLDRKKDLVGIAGFGLVAVTLLFISLHKTIEHGGISLAIILLYSASAFVVILARVFLKEALTPKKIAAVVMVIAGVSLVSLGGSSSGVEITVTSVSWGMVAALSYSSFYIIGKGFVARYRPVVLLAFLFPVGAIGLLPLADFTPKTTDAWAYIVLLAVASTYLSNLVYYTGLKQIEASRAVLIASLEPVMAAALAAWLFGERLGPWGVVGAVLVVAASALTALTRARRRSRASE